MSVSMLMIALSKSARFIAPKLMKASCSQTLVTFRAYAKLLLLKRLYDSDYFMLSDKVLLGLIKWEKVVSC
mgnify:CR=1 FL=1